MIDAGNYEGAVPMLMQIVVDDPNNADALNLLGYSSRQMGNYDQALGYYQQALSLEPEHLGANEYLGELYLEMNDLPKAEERLAVLATACDSGCEEYEDLAEEIAEYKAANGAT